MESPKYETADRVRTSDHASNTPDIYDQLENLIRSQSKEEKGVLDILVELGTPIVSIGVMDAGDITSKVFAPPGLREAASSPGSAQSFDNRTLFQAASISKPMTALAVIKLCQEGKLDLEAPITRYLNPEQLSWVLNPQTQALVSQISLRLLLSHTSGLRTQGFDGYSTTRIPTLPQILRGDPPANSEPISLFTLPGQTFSYSGGGFTVVQLILETQFQKAFHQIMDEILLRPLKMTRSTFQLLPGTEKNYAPAYSNGKKKTDPDHYSFPESAAAGLWTTPTDLLRAIQAVQLSLKSDNFLERKWAEIMLKEVEDNGFALGWRAKKDGTHFEHAGGNDPGYRCFVSGYADLARRQSEDDEQHRNMEADNQIPNNSGICVMTSSAMGYVVHDKILAAVSYLKGWPSVLERPLVPFHDRARSVDIQAKDWCGAWGPGEWNVVEENGISVRYGTLPPVPLIPAAQPCQKYEEGNSIDLVAEGLEMMLRFGWNGGARIIEVWQDGDVTTLERKA